VPRGIEVNGVNPVTYLADVLMRVQTHPASRIDELLPLLLALIENRGNLNLPAMTLREAEDGSLCHRECEGLRR
jgi:hypothetical protein